MQANMHKTLRGRTKTGVATAATAALVITGVGLAAPATAKSAPINYDCTATAFGAPVPVPGVIVVTDSNAPTKMPVGKRSVIKMTSTVTIPESFSALLAILADQVDGTAKVKVSTGKARTVSTLKIPKTAVPTGTGAMDLVATGHLTKFRPTKVGSHALKTARFRATVNLYKDEAPNALVPSAPIACPAPAANTTFDTIKVVKDKTKIVKFKVKKNVKQHQRAKADLKVKSKHGLTAHGKVKMILKKGKKTIQKKNVKLNKHGVAKASFKKLHKKGTYEVISTYKATKNFKGAKKKVRTFSVR